MQDTYCKVTLNCLIPFTHMTNTSIKPLTYRQEYTTHSKYQLLIVLVKVLYHKLSAITHNHCLESHYLATELVLNRHQ